MQINLISTDRSKILFERKTTKHSIRIRPSFQREKKHYYENDEWKKHRFKPTKKKQIKQNINRFKRIDIMGS